MRAEVIQIAAPEALTDLGNAQRFLHQYGHELRHVALWQKWLYWDGARFRLDETGHVRRLAVQTVQSIYAEAANAPEELRKELGRHALRSEQATRLREMVYLAESDERVARHPDDFDCDPMLLNTSKGTIDLETGTFTPHKHPIPVTKLAPVDYSPDATAETFYRFLERVIPSPDVRLFLQRACGYSLTGLTNEQVIFLLYGMGANGKSTLIELLMSMLGNYAIKAPAEMLLAKRNDGIPNDVARLRGARFASMVEIEDGRRLAESRVKELTGGDTITARFMRAEFFEFKPVCKIWLATNHKPQVRGTDHALWRRLRLIPFEVTIPDEDRDANLLAKLQAELPGILTWAVDGCLAWQREGLQAPPEVVAATNEYRDEQDVLGAFLDERCNLGIGLWVFTKDLYGAYRTWCETNSEKTVSQRSFALQLRERGCESSRKGHGGQRIWRGIGLVHGDG